MKKTSFLLTMLLFAFLAHAQYDEIKQNLMFYKFKEAKTELDKKWPNAKFVAKPEAYMLKANIYAGLAADSATRLTSQGEQLQADADAAFKKYKEMDPSMALMKDPVYKSGPINIYSNYFAAGYKDYEAKKWASSFENFKKTSEYSDMLSAQGLLTSKLDTNVLILAAYTAENNNNKDEAAKFYTRLADAKVKGAGYEGIYRFLVTYYFDKKDMANFEKYKDLGKELYPESQFFTYDKTDFAVGLEDNFAAKLKSLEQVLTNDPNNYKANLSLGQIIYDTLDGAKEGGVKPANAAELEPKMVTAFTKASESKPDEVLPYLYLGDHFIKKSVSIDEARAAHVADMKKRTKPTAAPSKEDVAKRDELNKDYNDAYESARVNYEKAAEIFGKKGVDKLTRPEKQQYKTVAGYLGDIYTYKLTQVKGKADLTAKYTAEEKKWNDLYGSIK